MSLQEFTVEVEAPLKGSGVVTISVDRGVLSPFNNAATASIPFTFDATAPRIERVGDQTIMVDTDYLLKVRIDGSPDDVHVDGLYEDFSYDWQDPLLEIWGTPENIWIAELWVIRAMGGGFTRYRYIDYDIVPGLPLITIPESLTFYRSVYNRVIIPVINMPDDVRVDGSIIGLTAALLEAEEVVDGSVPPHSDFTRDAGEIKVRSENVSGVDEVRGIMPRITRITMSADGVRS